MLRVWAAPGETLPRNLLFLPRGPQRSAGGPLPLTAATQGPRHPSSDSNAKTIARTLLSAEVRTIEKMTGGPTAGKRASKLQQVELILLGVEHPPAASAFDEALVTTVSKSAELRKRAMGDFLLTIGKRLLRPISRTGLRSPGDARPRTVPMPPAQRPRCLVLKGEAGMKGGHHRNQPSVRACFLCRTCMPLRQRLYKPLL